MVFQYGTLFHIDTQRAGACFIKGFATRTASKRVSFWDTRRKTTLNDRITRRTVRIPRATLTDKVITGMDITVSPIGTVLAHLFCYAKPLNRRVARLSC